MSPNRASGTPDPADRQRRLGPQIVIDRTWDGEPLGGGEVAALELSWVAEGLRVRLEAPFHGDPAPPAAEGGLPGRAEGLWEHEVVELFIASAASVEDRPVYLEIELGPHGHYLLLRHEGVRQRVGLADPLLVWTQIEGDRWWGEMVVARQALPPEPWVGNAYAIHGVGTARRYLAAVPVAGERPDFHQARQFQPLVVG